MSAEREPGILIVGGNGYLGQHLVSRLQQGHWPLKVTSSKPGSDGLIHLDAEDESMPENLFDGVGTVVHVAGLAHSPGAEERHFLLLNRDFPGRIAKAAAQAGVRNFIYISSVSVYGPENGEQDETSRCHPETLYGRSKQQGEQTIADAAKDSAMKTANLRLATLYGRNDPGNFGRLARWISSGRFIQIGEGHNRKSILHVSDAVEAMAACLHKGLVHKEASYNLVGEVISMRDLVRILTDQSGVKPRLRLPAFPVKTASAALKAISLGYGPAVRIDDTISKWLQNDLYNGDLFKNEFSFNPSHLSAEYLRDLLA